MTQQELCRWIINHKVLFSFTMAAFTFMLMYYAILYVLQRVLIHDTMASFSDLEDPCNISSSSVSVEVREEKLGEIPVTTVVEDEDGEEQCDPCSVCLEKFEKGEEVRVLPHCEHVYHRGCIDTWLLRYSLRCPMCRDKTLAVPLPATCYAMV